MTSSSANPPISKVPQPEVTPTAVEREEPMMVDIDQGEVEASEIVEDDIAPLRERIQLDPEMSRDMDMRRKVGELLKDKCGDLKDGFIDLKSSDQWRHGGWRWIRASTDDRVSLAERRQTDDLMRRLRENMSTVGKAVPRRKECDFVVKESKEAGGMTHQVKVSSTVKCVTLAGKIDPLLSRGVDALLSEAERAEWASLSNRGKLNKHRALLLAAEAERYRAKRANFPLQDDGCASGDKAAKKRDAPQKNDGLSDDDYEWKEEDQSGGSYSESGGSATDRGSEVADEEESDEAEDIVGANTSSLRERKKTKIVSDDEDGQEDGPVAEGVVPANSVDRKYFEEFFDNGLQFFDIHTTQNDNDDGGDVFGDSQSMFGLSMDSQETSLSNEQVCAPFVFVISHAYLGPGSIVAVVCCPCVPGNICILY